MASGLAAQPPAAKPASGVIKLTSLEWPPYTGATLREQGASTAVVRAALAAMDYRLYVEFFPWRRAVALVARRSEFAGYFPEYLSSENAQNCLVSAPIGTGPLGFAERVDAPVHWAHMEDLAQYRIGIVGGYVNTSEFDRRVRENKQAVDVASSDTQNLLKLAAGRVPLAVIDRRVFEYLTRHDPRIRPLAPQLHFNDHLLEDKRLYVCFRRDSQGAQARKIFYEGLKKIDVAAVMANALK